MKCSLASLLGTPFGLRHRRRGGCDGYCAPSEICRQTSRERLPRSQSVGLFYSAVTCLVAVGGVPNQQEWGLVVQRVLHA
jgi:hypothetical protein